MCNHRATSQRKQQESGQPTRRRKRHIKPRKHDGYTNEKYGASDVDEADPVDPYASQTKKTFEKVLDALNGKLQTGELSRQARKLVQELEGNLMGIRIRFEDTHIDWHLVVPQPETMDERIRRALAISDPVLAYCIANEIAEPDICKLFRKPALQTYITRAEDYDAALGEAVPERLRKKAAPHLARRKYRDGSNPTARDDWEVFLEDTHHQVGGLPTGLASLDAALGGGASDLTVIGADEGDGKTSLCLAMMVAALRADPQLGCVYYTIDQSKAMTMNKLFSLVARLSPAEIKLSPEDRSEKQNRQIDKADAELRNDLLPRIKFVERSNLSAGESLTPSSLGMSHNELRANAADVHRVLVIIDLFQSLVQLCEVAGTGNEADEYCLDLIQRYIQWSRTDSCPEGSPVIIASEIRKVDRTELTANDLRGSARLGSMPSNIVLLWPTPGSDQTGEVVPRTLKIAKSRNGDEGLLQVQFHHKICKFTETSEGNQPGSRRCNTGENERSARLDPANDL